eukprot:GFUD01132527.1.p1 GENE.GFUD01132527.1~~GFUD01132527.1.p1  ORF type:complete len:244 (-),score=55.15 GFUD01132527.1:46-777(-)
MADLTVSTTFQQRVQRRTFRILQLLLFCDIFCLITSGILFFLSSLSKDPPLNRSLLLQVSGFVGSYGSISAFCNCFASYGIRTWRRSFLLPYLTFFPMVLTILLIYLVSLFYKSGIITGTVLINFVLPLLTSILMVYIWLKLLKQWFTMSRPLAVISLPSQQDVESQTLALARAFAFLHLSPGPGIDQDVGSTRDLPPKYETLEVDMTAPPEYEEAVEGGELFSQPVSEDKIESVQEIHVQVL